MIGTHTWPLLGFSCLLLGNGNWIRLEIRVSVLSLRPKAYQWCHIAPSHCKVTTAAWTQKFNQGLIQSQTQCTLGQREVKWRPPDQCNVSLLKQIFEHIPKSIWYLDSPKTSDLILYPHLFLIIRDLSLICSIYKEGWQYREATVGKTVKQDAWEARTGQGLSSLGATGLEGKGASPGGQWKSRPLMSCVWADASFFFCTQSLSSFLLPVGRMAVSRLKLAELQCS